MSKIKTCVRCHKEFRMIDMELAFYKKQGYPEPDHCPVCRQKRRETLRNPHEFFRRPCDKCGKEMITTYNPNKNLIVYCVSCFQDYYNRVDPLTEKPFDRVKK